jgi:SAM-dependent methyltransferase
MNPFADPALAAGYEVRYQTAGRRADQLEKRLLMWLLARFPSAVTLLEVGCGSGHFARWFGEKTLQVKGLDISLPMLSEALRLDSVPYVLGDALALPFPDNAFDLGSAACCQAGINPGNPESAELLGLVSAPCRRACMGSRPLLHASRDGPVGTPRSQEIHRNNVADNSLAPLAGNASPAMGWLYRHGGAMEVTSDEQDHNPVKCISAR